MRGWIEWIIIITEENVFFVDRLVPDAKPDRGMMWQAENPELAREFTACTASKARQSRLHQAQGVFPVFVFSADTGTKRDGHGARGAGFSMLQSK